MRAAAFAVLAALATPAGGSALETRYELLIAGNPAGEQVVHVDDDGVVHVRFSYNDRGRGPELQARYRLADDGVPTNVHIEGIAYMKTPVDERFERDGDTVRWHNTSEAVERDLDGPAFYLSLEGPPEEQMLLARALLRSENRELALLPSGRARIEALADLEFDGTPVTLYALHGLGLTPALVWFDGDHRLYASVSDWFSLVRSGGADRVPALLDAQRDIEQQAHHRRAAELTQVLDAPLLIRNVRAFDPVHGAVIGDSVVVDGGRIAAVGRDLDPPGGATVLDGEDRFLMPGLWDMHVHLGGPADGLLHLAFGVTTVRDLANINELLARRSEDFDAGRDIGPRILKAGFLDGSGPFAGPSKALADDSESVWRWIDRYADEGYVQLKLYSSLKRELVPDAIEYAHAKGLRVSGHVPVGMSAREFIELGADELQHANFLFLNFLAGRGDDTRTPLRFRMVAERAGQVDLSGAEVNAFIELLRRRDIVVDPTLVAFEDLFVSQPHRPAPVYAEVFDRLPISWQRRIGAGSGGLEAPDGAAAMRNRAAFDRMIALVGDLHRSGVTIIAGTDAAAGLAFARELELYVQGGIPPIEVLRIATVNAARTMGLEDERGRLAHGQTADLILIDGDPTRIISDVRRVHTVIRGDRLFRAEALARAAGLSGGG